MENRLLTPDDVAEELGVPRATLYQWRFYGKGPRAVKVGRHIRFRRVDLDSWIEDQADPLGNQAAGGATRVGR